MDDDSRAEMRFPDGPHGTDPAEAAADGEVVEVSLHDPSLLTILSTEHWSLLSARGLVYNEAFTRVATFLTLVSMSLVALALLAQVMRVGGAFLAVTAVTLSFNLIVGLATIIRVLAAVDEDLRALHAMSRIRHGYVQIAPRAQTYLTHPTHDDVRSVMAVYGPAHAGFKGVLYFLSTSLGLMVLLVSLTAGVIALVVAVAASAVMSTGIWLGSGVGIATFLALGMMSRRSILAGQAGLESVFPASAPRDADGT